MQKTTEELQKEVLALIDLLREAQAEIKNLKTRLIEYEKLYKDYDDNWSWVTKIVYLITQADRPLKASEIIDLMQTKDPRLELKDTILGLITLI